jgi:hypothetical protein
MLLCDQSGVGKDRNQKALALEIAIDIEEITPKKWFSAGDKAPYGPYQYSLLNDFFYLLKRKFVLHCHPVLFGYIDVAMPAVIVTSGRKF